jgi:hypothetical protein
MKLEEVLQAYREGKKIYCQSTQRTLWRDETANSNYTNLSSFDGRKICFFHFLVDDSELNSDSWEILNEPRPDQIIEQSGINSDAPGTSDNPGSDGTPNQSLPF